MIPRGLTFTPDGTMLASGEESFDLGRSVDNFPRSTMLHLWEIATGHEVRRWEVRAMGTACLAFAPGGKNLAWVGGNETSSGSGTRPRARGPAADRPSRRDRGRRLRARRHGRS